MCFRIASSEPLIKVFTGKQDFKRHNMSLTQLHLMWAKKDVAASLTLLSKLMAHKHEGTKSK